MTNGQPDVNTYNARDINLTLLGPEDKITVTGFGEDMITWEKQEAFFESSVGAQGDVVVNETNNNLYDLTITLQPSSPTLKYIYKWMNSRTEFGVEGSNDTTGLSFGGSHARVVEAPEISLGTEAEDVEVKITVFDGSTNYSNN